MPCAFLQVSKKKLVPKAESSVGAHAADPSSPDMSLSLTSMELLWQSGESDTTRECSSFLGGGGGGRGNLKL